jgi:hypothetical protein
VYAFLLPSTLGLNPPLFACCAALQLHEWAEVLLQQLHDEF